MSANDTQVGGDHYKSPGKVEHWDIVAQHDLDYFQGQITKYVMRWKKKNGLQDLEKAEHFLAKYLEVERERARLTDPRQYHMDFVHHESSIQGYIERRDAAAARPDGKVGAAPGQQYTLR